MDFYKVIAAEYSQLFPSSREKLDFVERYLTDKPDPVILDIGCATGDFIMQLASPKRNLIGIDLDGAMIDIARSRLPAGDLDRIRFIESDMIEHLSSCPERFFDALTCMGNTVVYLEGEIVLDHFLSQAERALKPGGVLIIQILNYGNPMIGPGFEFSRVETDRLVLNRTYRRSEPDSSHLEFITTVTDKATGASHIDTHRQSPFQTHQIEEAARRVGFTDVDVFGSYNGDKPMENDFFRLLVIHSGHSFQTSTHRYSNQ